MIPSTFLSETLKSIYSKFSSFDLIFDLDAHDIKGKKKFLFAHIENLTLNAREKTLQFDLVIDCYFLNSNDLYEPINYLTEVINVLTGKFDVQCMSRSDRILIEPPRRSENKVVISQVQTTLTLEIP